MYLWRQFFCYINGIWFLENSWIVNQLEGSMHYWLYQLILVTNFMQRAIHIFPEKSSGLCTANSRVFDFRNKHISKHELWTFKIAKVENEQRKLKHMRLHCSILILFVSSYLVNFSTWALSQVDKSKSSNYLTGQLSVENFKWKKKFVNLLRVVCLSLDRYGWALTKFKKKYISSLLKCCFG